MNNKGYRRLLNRSLLLPVLLSSVSVWANDYDMYNDHDLSATTQAPQNIDTMRQAESMSQSSDGFLEESQETHQVNMGYVGGDTRVGVGLDSEFRLRGDVSHIFLDTADTVASGEGWVGIDPTAEGDEEVLTGAGAKLNYHWLSQDENGQASHVNKAFVAYDRNEAEDQKVSAGYGQESENLFWSGHVSKGISDERVVGKTHYDTVIREKAFDYGVGARAGTMLNEQLLRVQGGFDYEWGEDYGSHEELPGQLTLSGGVEKFFMDSPHSVSANIELSKAHGGYDGDDSDADVSGNINYRYDFGGEGGLFQSDQRYRRVRVEIPGKTEVVKIPRQQVIKVPRQQVVKVPRQQVVKVPRHQRIRVQKPSRVHRKLVKHTMELEADTFFRKGGHQLTHEAQNRMRNMIARIRDAGHEGNIRITGNTCDLGSAAYNQKLSERRALTVRKFMVANGFVADQLLVRGMGESNPKYPNTDQMRHRNRRVDIEYVTYQNHYKDEVIHQGYDEKVKTVYDEKVKTVYDEKIKTVYDEKVKTVYDEQVRVSKPRVVWRKELIPSPPAWVQRALRNNIQYKQTIGTYRTAEGVDGNVGRAIAVDDHATTHQGQAVTINVLANDSGHGNLRIINNDFETANGGKVTNEGGQLVYQPAEGFYGEDQFVYKFEDDKGQQAIANVKVTVIKKEDGGDDLFAEDDQVMTHINTPVHIDVLANDKGQGTLMFAGYMNPTEQGGTVNDQDGKLIYTPREGFYGEDRFEYGIKDDSGNEVRATVIITVKQSDDNQAPEAVDDYVKTSKGQAISIDVLANDNDEDKGSLAIADFSETSAGGGMVSRQDGHLVYTPSADFTGTDQFTYTLVDQHGKTDTATVYIEVSEVVDYRLIAEDDGTEGEQEGSAYSFHLGDTQTRQMMVMSNDSGDDLQIIGIVSPPVYGTAIVSADGRSINYTLRNGYCEDHSFVYRVRDKYGNEADATVYINIFD